MFGKKKDIETYFVGGGWGDRIGYKVKEDGSLRVDGHKYRIPRDGDQLIVPMESGAKGIFIFENVKPCGDPKDMFFADAYPTGQYYEEVDE